MANKRISELPLKVTPDDADFIPLVDTQTGINNYTSKKTTVGGLMSRVDELAAAQIALQKGVAGGLATLEPITGKVPSSQLPGYVDDVEEYPSFEEFPAVGEAGKLYVALDTRLAYRWGGTIYVEISASPGSTDGVPEGLVNKYFTEQRAADAAPVQSVNGYVGEIDLDKTDVGLGNVDNTSDLNKPISTATQTALDGKSAVGHGHGISDVSGLQTALDGKSAVGHGHGISDVSGLQTALDGKSATGHGHAIGDVSGLQTALDGKSAVGHGHGISDVSGLQTALDGKAPAAGSTNITTIGAATATSINKVTITQPATAATLTIANNKTFSVSNTLTMTGADGAAINVGAGGTVVYENSIIDGGAY